MRSSTLKNAAALTQRSLKVSSSVGKSAPGRSVANSVVPSMAWSRWRLRRERSSPSRCVATPLTLYAGHSVGSAQSSGPRPLSNATSAERSGSRTWSTSEIDAAPSTRGFLLQWLRCAAAHTDVMRLLVSSSDLAGGWRGLDVYGRDHVVDVWEELADDVALEAADDLLFAASFGGAAGDVVLGGLV